MDHPDGVRCIQDPRVVENRSLCGRTGDEWRFMGVDGALVASQHESSLRPCASCVRAVVALLSKPIP
jgi:hypothetical protein